MTSEQLKNSILQEAISGRLVPQDPNDEPASALLTRIREEKARLVKEGKLKKKDLVETPITEEEIPFEIPASWEWCRIHEISQSYIGLTYSPADVSEDGIIVLRSSNIKSGKLTLNDIVRVKKEINEKLQVALNDIIICARNGSRKLVGKSALITEMSEPMTFGAFMAICKTPFYSFVYQFLQSNLFFSQLRKVSDTTTINQLTQNNFNSFLIPLPPLAEQKRIVAKLEELLPIVNQYGKAQKELDELNTALPARLRQSILQEAIQGNLTEHDLSDKWADEYCTKLPKLKYKSNPEWPQDYPFEIPENWRWCRIGDICELLNGYAFKSNQYKDKGVRVIRITNVQDGYIVDNSPKFYPSIPDIEKYTLKEGDLLMSLTGNVGRVGILPQSMLPAALNQRVACLRLKDERLKPFLFWYLRCPIFRERCEDSGHGMAQLNISTEWVKQEYFPLPPLAEQQRIVAKIEELFEQIDKIKK